MISKEDLFAYIWTKVESSLDLSAYIGGHLAANIPASINGIIYSGTKDLGSSLTGVYGPHDLRAYLNVYYPGNLSATIHGWYRGIKNLGAIVGGWESIDLGATISMISGVDLPAYITAIGKLADLPATIIPKTIRMKRALLISLLEHKDLAATINFQCFGSNYSDLNAYLNILYKKDLQASIWGMRTPTANYHDLAAYINTADYNVQDTYTVRFIPEIRKYTKLKITFNIGDSYKTFDTLPIFYSNFYGADLAASITGEFTNYDLGASITPVIQSNYTDLPDSIWPKTHETVIDFDYGWRENWRKIVELSFQKEGADPYHYFYISANQQAYRLDRARHWTIWAKSYTETDDMIERRNIRRKHIYKLSDYDTIDEAVDSFSK